MSIKFLDQFQQQIYKVLSSDKVINSLIKKIYIGAIQDGQYPFLLINIQNIDRISGNINHLHSINFQISSYAKDHHHKLLLTLANHIIRIFSQPAIICQDFQILNINYTNITLEKARDLIVNKLLINYKVLIQENIDG